MEILGTIEYKDEEYININENEIFNKFNQLDQLEFIQISNDNKFNFVLDERLNVNERLQIIDLLLVKDLANDDYRREYLKKVGWIKSNNSADTGTLYDYLLKETDFSNILFKKKITNNLLNKFGFNNLNEFGIAGNCASVYIENRAILQRNIPDFKAELNDNNEIEVTYKSQKDECKLRCLFRHLRNSIAHNNVFYLKEDTFFFIDYDKDKKNNNKGLTAAIIIEKNQLLKWKEIIENGKKIKKHDN